MLVGVLSNPLAAVCSLMSNLWAAMSSCTREAASSRSDFLGDHPSWVFEGN
jgi:hypothetical protein